MTRSSLNAIASLLLLAGLLGLPALASASEITVNTTADQPPTQPECAGAAGDCSLRQAIDVANHHSLQSVTIVLPAGHYRLTIHGNEEDAGNSGDLDITDSEDVTIHGAGARRTTVDATGLGDRVFDVLEGGSLRLKGLTVTGGEAPDGDGGGIRSRGGILHVERVAVLGNTATGPGSGGGVYADRSLVMVDESLLARNRDSGNGGGLYSEETWVTMVNTTIADNAVDTGLYPGDPSWGAHGGGAEIRGGTLLLQNVTVSGNSIRDGNGGEEGAGAGLSVYANVTDVVSTILYGNSGVEVETTGQCGDPIPSSGHNLEAPPPPGESRCFSQPTDLIADPMLGPLRNNGGETDTMALPAASPAIDAGESNRCPASDQRGSPRQILRGCDIGAFEYMPPPPRIKRKGKVHVKATDKTFLVMSGFKVHCLREDGLCTGTIEAGWKGSIGKATFGVGPGRTKALSLKLNRRGARLLNERGKLKARFDVSCTVAWGAIATARAKLVLKLPPARHE
jgi:hypothetical protein